MDSSPVREASRCAISAGEVEPPRGTASTLVGWRGPNRAPAQSAPKISTSAARIMRARLEVFTAVMVVVPSDVPMPIVEGKSRSGSPRHLTSAEFGGESFDLAASFLERAGTVDFLGGQTQFFLDGKLGGNAAAGFGFAEAAREEALELLFRRAPSHHEAVQVFVNAGFDQERGFDEGGVARAAPLPFLELTEDDFGDARMDDGVEAVESGAIGEDDGAELWTVNAAIGGHHPRAEFLEDFVVGRQARLDEPMGQGVGVEDGEAHFAEHGGDGAFAAGDAAGESESEHDGELSRAGGRLRCGKFGRGASEARGFHRVTHEHGDGHGTDAAGHGRERSGNVDGAGVHVADESTSFGAEFL